MDVQTKFWPQPNWHAKGLRTPEELRRANRLHAALNDAALRLAAPMLERRRTRA